jgi:hypothetical protein
MRPLPSRRLPRRVPATPARPGRPARGWKVLAQDVLALGALASITVHLAATLLLAAPTAVERVRGAAAHARETELAASRRLFGSDFALGVESIRQALGEGEPYLLVHAGERWGGGPFWVRYALAPRAAVFLGHLERVLPGRPGWQRIESETLPHLVVANGHQEEPDLYERQEFLDFFAPAPPRHGR